MEFFKLWGPALCISKDPVTQRQRLCTFYQAEDETGKRRPIGHAEAIALHIAQRHNPDLRRRRIREPSSLTSASIAKVKAHLRTLGLEAGRDYEMNEIMEARREIHIGIHDPIPDGWTSIDVEPIASDPRLAPQDRLRRCPAHEAVEDDFVRYAACRTEFVLEQTARVILVEQHLFDWQEGNYSYEMLTETVPGVPGARKVRVAYKGATTAQVAQARAMLDLQFGPGRVEVS